MVDTTISIRVDVHSEMKLNNFDMFCLETISLAIPVNTVAKTSSGVHANTVDALKIV